MRSIASRSAPIRLVGREGFEPPSVGLRGPGSAVELPTHESLAPGGGFEPPSPGLTGPRSTVELPRIDPRISFPASWLRARSRASLRVATLARDRALRFRSGAVGETRTPSLRHGKPTLWPLELRPLESGAPGGIRTRIARLTRSVLCSLSYRGPDAFSPSPSFPLALRSFWRAREDSNLQPRGSKPRTLIH